MNPSRVLFKQGYFFQNGLKIKVNEEKEVSTLQNI